MKYQTKVVEVEAIKLGQRLTLPAHENRSPQDGHPGDYLLTYPDGHHEIWSAELFGQTMEPVPEKAAFTLHGHPHVTLGGGIASPTQCRSVDAVSTVRGRESMSVPSFDGKTREVVFAPDDYVFPPEMVQSARASDSYNLTPSYPNREARAAAALDDPDAEMARLAEMVCDPAMAEAALRTLADGGH